MRFVTAALVGTNTHNSTPIITNFAAILFRLILSPSAGTAIRRSSSRSANGISSLKVREPVRASRYFSMTIAAYTITMYPATSANLFAIGVVASPGTSAAAVASAIEVPVMTMALFSIESSVSIVFG